MISKYECYDRFSKVYIPNSDDYKYVYSCPLCRECPFFEPEYAHPCKLYREKLTERLNEPWSNIKVLVEKVLEYEYM